MNTRRLWIAILSTTLSWSTVQADTELQSLRSLVAEQERQIRMLEEENARLKADSMPRGTRTLQAGGTNTVTTRPNSPASPSTTTREYTVVAGDNLVRIGRRLGVSADALAMANGIQTSSIIRPGQILKVPGGSTATASQSAAPAPSTPTPAPATRTHTVQAGETYYSISRQHKVAVDRLIAANPETPASALRVGQKIKLPQSETAATREAPTVAPRETAAVEQPLPPAPQTQSGRQGIRTVTIEGQMRYGAFAAKHGTTTERLNQLNALDLDARTVLAKGSELYVPAQP